MFHLIKTTVLPLMFHLINIDSVTLYVFYPWWLMKNNSYTPYILFEKDNFYFFKCFFSLRPIKNNSVTPYVFISWWPIKKQQCYPLCFIHDDKWKTSCKYKFNSLHINVTTSMRIKKSSITIVMTFFRCLDGALISSEVNTLNSSGLDPRKNVDRGTTVVIYWSTWKKHEG